MEELLKKIKELLIDLSISIYKLCVLIKEKWNSFIEMLKRVFKPRKRKLN